MENRKENLQECSFTADTDKKQNALKILQSLNIRTVISNEKKNLTMSVLKIKANAFLDSRRGQSPYRKAFGVELFFHFLQ